MATQYEQWQIEQKEIRYAQNSLLFAEYTKELHQVYDRYLEIIEEILIDLSPQLDDDQYEGITAYSYEDELKELKEKREKLEPIIEKKIEEEKHQELLKDIGMTQEQYDAHLKSIDDDDKQRRVAKIKKTNRTTPKKK